MSISNLEVSGSDMDVQETANVVLVDTYPLPETLSQGACYRFILAEKYFLTK